MCFQLLFALLVTLQVGSNLVEASNYDYEDGGLLFNPGNIIEMPVSCKGKPFCFEKGENYPDEIVDKLVKNLPNMELEDSEARLSLGSRYGYTEPECKTNRNDSLIYYITDTNNEMRVVVQSRTEGHFRQKYDLSWCLEEGPVIRTTHFLKGMKCVTKTMDLDFFVLVENYISERDPRLTVATAKIPVCCRCERDTED